MDGSSQIRRLNQLLNEDADSDFLDKKSSYDYLYEAAKECVRRTQCIVDTQTITTIADQAGYTLDGDFLSLYLQDNDNDFYIVYNDGSNNHFIKFREYGRIIYADQSDDSQSVPDFFTIINDSTLDSQVTGTATSAGDDTGGKSLLTDTAGDFSDVTAGDPVHNTTDSSSGVVISVPSTTTAYVALFGGTDNEWDSSDAYIIQPRARFKIVFDPPPSTADHTATVYYLQKPAPVYSDYDVYNIPFDYSHAFPKYAYFLYKYRNKEPKLGDPMYIAWDQWIRKECAWARKTYIRNKIKVNLKCRS